ncbi:hypothetical protein G6F65_014468 [Rhizopus arrhizus]|nr:hypothetical protein G6F65_014468 [Rhizopus arrhizus]
MQDDALHLVADVDAPQLFALAALGAAFELIRGQGLDHLGKVAGIDVRRERMGGGLGGRSIGGWRGGRRIFAFAGTERGRGGQAQEEFAGHRRFLGNKGWPYVVHDRLGEDHRTERRGGSVRRGGFGVERDRLGAGDRPDAGAAVHVQHHLAFELQGAIDHGIGADDYARLAAGSQRDAEIGLADVHTAVDLRADPHGDVTVDGLHILADAAFDQADATVHGFNAAFDLAATVAEDAAVDRADAAMRNDFAAQAHAAVDCLDLAGACAVGHFHPAVDGIDTAGFRAFANADTAVDRIQLAVALAGFGADAAVDLADVVLGAGRAGCEQDAQQQRNGKSFHGDLDGCAAGRPLTGKPLRDNAFPSRRHHIAAARGGRCLLLALAIALALPLPAAAQSTRETERKLQKLRTELKGVAQERRQIEGQRGQASQQLREADEKVARSGRALAQTETALREQSRALAEAEQRRSSLQNNLAQQHRELAGLLRAAYQLGNHAPLKLLLSQDTVADANRTGSPASADRRTPAEAAGRAA